MLREDKSVSTGENFSIRNRLILVIGIIFLGIFYSFSREVKHGFLKQTDFNVTVRMQDNIPARFDEIWEDLAFFVTPIPSIFFVGLLTIAAFADKKTRFRALFIPILFAALIYGELYGKTVVHHPAPPFFMIKNPTTVFSKYYVNEQFSYPSGHAARATFLAFLMFITIQQYNNLTMRKRLLLIGGLGIYVGLVSISRIYLGHHWLSDVVGGLVLGAGFGILAI